MSACLRAALALDLLLMGIEHTVPLAHSVLPLGGDPIIQFGALMCIGIAAREVACLFKRDNQD